MDVLEQLDRIPGIPKGIKPQTHRLLDWATIGAFFVMAGVMWGRNKRGSIAALVNGGLVLGTTLLTDYDGDGKRPLSFPTHGKLDMVQASMAAAAPTVLGFADEHPGHAWLFRGQAINETMVVRMTDWDAAKHRRRLFRRAA